MMTREQIIRMGTSHGYRVKKVQPRIGLITFIKGNVQVNVYQTTMTVGTALSHPRRGKTQLFRRKVSLFLLDRIFANPRVHTSKGYRKK